eukprot:Pgem_evm2s3920
MSTMYSQLRITKLAITMATIFNYVSGQSLISEFTYNKNVAHDGRNVCGSINPVSLEWCLEQCKNTPECKAVLYGNGNDRRRTGKCFCKTDIGVRRLGPHAKAYDAYIKNEYLPEPTAKYTLVVLAIKLLYLKIYK